MDTKENNKNLFLIKILKSKGFAIDDALALTDEQLRDSGLTWTIIDMIKAYKDNGAKTETVLEKEIEDNKTVIEDKEHQQNIIASVIDELVPPVTNNDAESADADNSENNDDGVYVEHIINNELENKVREVLMSKEYKGYAPYINLLRKEIPAEEFETIDGTIVSTLIRNRVNEVKGQ